MTEGKKKIGRPPGPEAPMTTMSIRLPTELVAFYRAAGPHTTLMREVLTQYMQRHKNPHG